VDDDDAPPILPAPPLLLPCVPASVTLSNCPAAMEAGLGCRTLLLKFTDAWESIGAVVAVA